VISLNLSAAIVVKFLHNEPCTTIEYTSSTFVSTAVVDAVASHATRGVSHQSAAELHKPIGQGVFSHLAHSDYIPVRSLCGTHCVRGWCDGCMKTFRFSVAGGQTTIFTVYLALLC
jgi:hypothetical protein